MELFRPGWSTASGGTSTPWGRPERRSGRWSRRGGRSPRRRRAGRPHRLQRPHRSTTPLRRPGLPRPTRLRQPPAPTPASTASPTGSTTWSSWAPTAWHSDPSSPRAPTDTTPLTTSASTPGSATTRPSTASPKPAVTAVWRSCSTASSTTSAPSTRCSGPPPPEDASGACSTSTMRPVLLEPAGPRRLPGPCPGMPFSKGTTGSRCSTTTVTRSPTSPSPCSPTGWSGAPPPGGLMRPTPSRPLSGRGFCRACAASIPTPGSSGRLSTGTTPASSNAPPWIRSPSTSCGRPSGDRCSMRTSSSSIGA